MLLSSYDAARDFSLTQNPNGPWSYGVRFTETADYAPFGIPKATALDFGSGAMGWSENSGSPPYVGINVTGQEYDSEGIALPTGVLVMHPGPNGEFSDVRFTVPTTGALNLTYKFSSIDSAATSIAEDILINGVHFSGGHIGGGQSYGLTTQLNATQGDTLDFLVGVGTNNSFQNDATSLSLQITTSTTGGNYHLVFSQQPKSGDTGAQQPLQVKLEDAKNRLVNTSIEGVILELNTPGDINDELLTESVYAPFKHGVATFTAQTGPQTNLPGTYTFTASTASGPHAAVALAASATSTAFTLSNPHLAFIKQPNVFADIGDLISFSVRLENAKNKPIIPSGADPRVLLRLYSAMDGSNNYSADEPLIASKIDSLSVDLPGTYYVVATQVDANENVITSTMPATSRTFTVLPDHLVFTKQPTTTGVYAAIPFAVELRNGKNKPVFPKTGGAIEVVISIPGQMPEVGFVQLLNSKFDNTKPPAGESSFYLPLTTPSSVSVTEVNSNSVAIASVATITSNPFSVVADHLAFKRQPSTVKAGIAVPFQVVVEDPRNKLVSLPAGFKEPIFFGATATTGSGTIPVPSAYSLTSSQFNNVLNGGDAAIKVSAPGTYTLTAQLADFVKGPDAAFQPVTSKVFKVL